MVYQVYTRQFDKQKYTECNDHVPMSCIVYFKLNWSRLFVGNNIS